MSLFPRFPRSFTGAERPLIRPPENHTLDYEGEVAVVIGKAGRRIKAEEAYDHIAALTLANEGTIRDWVRHAKFNVTQGKNWDNSGAIGPWLVPFTDAAQLDERPPYHPRERRNSPGRHPQPDDVPDPRGDRLYLHLHHPAARRCDHHRHPDRCRCPLRSAESTSKPGDVVEVEVKGIGILRNTVKDEA